MNAKNSLVSEIGNFSPVNSTFQEEHKVWNTMKHLGSTLFLPRISEGQNTTPFIHGTQDLKSERLKYFPQSDFGN
jgi:hypothetical protein